MVGGEAVEETEVGMEPQEQSPHSEDFVKSVATSTQPKIDWGAIASELVQKIDNVTQQITLLQKEITVSEERIAESEEAYQLVINPPRRTPKPGEFQLFDRLDEVVSQQRDEQQRAEKLQQVQQAILLGQQLVAQKQRQISLLEAELRNLQDELIWATKYALFIEKFEPSYRYPEPQQREIERHTQYLWDAEKILREAVEASKQSPEKVQRWIAGTIYDSPEKAIATYEQSVNRQREALAIASKRNETHFKRFIKSRVEIEKPLQELLTAQEQYRKALQAFSPLIQEHGEVLGLSKDDIGKLVNLKVPQVKDASGQIRMI